MTMVLDVGGHVGDSLRGFSVGWLLVLSTRTSGRRRQFDGWFLW